jgi:acetyl/propionyl-CoA carboxylase alpha subunit
MTIHKLLIANRESREAAFALVKTAGFPVMIKAAAGGGRGIRIARSAEEFHHLMPQAQAEALAAFGDGGLYVEKLMEGARHIEVQVLGDGRVIHCCEREYSLQRRRQKVWEEAPSPSLTSAIRKKLCSSAVALAKAAHYRGAGTLEYLYDDRSREFYFLEMNTRIQVEHPVTIGDQAPAPGARSRPRRRGGFIPPGSNRAWHHKLQVLPQQRLRWRCRPLLPPQPKNSPPRQH